MHQPTANADHERASEHASKLDEREVPRTNAHAAFVALEKLAVRLGELFDCFFFLCISLDYPNRGDSLLQCGEICANAFAHREVRLVGVALKLDGCGNEQRHHQQSNDGQLPTQCEQHKKCEHQQHSCGNELEQPPLHKFGHRLDICSHAGHKHTGFVSVVKRH